MKKSKKKAAFALKIMFFVSAVTSIYAVFTLKSCSEKQTIAFTTPQRKLSVIYDESLLQSELSALTERKGFYINSLSLGEDGVFKASFKASLSALPKEKLPEILRIGGQISGTASGRIYFCDGKFAVDRFSARVGFIRIPGDDLNKDLSLAADYALRRFCTAQGLAPEKLTCEKGKLIIEGTENQ